MDANQPTNQHKYTNYDLSLYRGHIKYRKNTLPHVNVPIVIPECVSSVTSGIPNDSACSLVRIEVGIATMSFSSPLFSNSPRRSTTQRERKGGERGCEGEAIIRKELISDWVLSSAPHPCHDYRERGPLPLARQTDRQDLQHRRETFV